MKFTYKLFFSITALLTAAFMLFGSFMLFFYFNRMLERETEQGKRENLLFQTIYDMVYQNMEKYGAEFAGIQAGNSATERMTDQNGTECMILETDGTITLEGSLKLPQDEIRSLAEEMIHTMDPGADQVYGVRKVGTRYYLLSIITDQATDSADMVYLGILKDLSGIYEERSNMMRQYGIALAGLLVIGGLAAFLLSRYLTRPIEQLNRTAGRIAEGNLEKRAAYQGADEIGELSRSFNRMTDRLVRQMEEKELEAKQKEDFTAAFAHELKTPLTSIIGYADMLNSYELTEQERGEATYYIFSQGKRLESLSHKLLELVGMDRQELEFKKIQTKEVREKMKENGAEVHILTALDDIAWMLNIRGNDIPCNPVVLSYLVLTETESHLFIQEETLNEKVKQYLADLGISLHPYDAVYDFVSGITGKTILLEKAKVNYTICQSVMGSNTIVNVMNPASSLKAVKTPVEMENIRKAHIKDGVAVTRFVYWLKKNIGKIPMDEVSVAEKLESFRKEQEGFIEPSFGTISAYGPNAAMCHYQATKDNFSVLQPKGMYLVDSGGQYYEGTTDITRTIVVGPLTEEEKEHFTITAMGTLRLGNAKFLHGCIGINLDYLARQAFWERGLDFNHGTGHGVGYLLNVHERPNGFRWKMVPERMENAVLEEGMLTSDEPGIYIEGSHGIRTENLMLCRKAEKNMYGQFMRFEFVTMVPIDLDGIDTQYMTEKDVELLNNYHKEVYEKISPYLEGDEKEWLKEATRPISK